MKIWGQAWKELLKIFVVFGFVYQGLNVIGDLLFLTGIYTMNQLTDCKYLRVIPSKPANKRFPQDMYSLREQANHFLRRILCQIYSLILPQSSFRLHPSRF